VSNHFSVFQTVGAANADYSCPERIGNDRRPHIGGECGPRIHHQPEAQHPNSSAIHKLPADYPIYGSIAAYLLRPCADLCPLLVQ
jgi:hypothetical protein